MPVQESDTLFFWKVRDGQLCIGITPLGFGQIKQGKVIATTFDVPQSVLGMQVELIKKKTVPILDNTSKEENKA